MPLPKLIALGGAGLAVAAVLVGYVLFSRGDSDDDSIVIVIAGIEVTQGEWARMVAEPHEWADCVREEIEDYDGPEADEQQRAVVVLARMEAGHSWEARTLGMAMIHLAAVAEARERGLDPTDAEVAAQVETTRRGMTSVVGGDFPATICTREQVEAAIAEVGEDRYWNEVVPEEQRRSLLVQNLWEAEDAGPGGGEYAFDLARSADVELRPALDGVVTLDDAYAFLDHYERLTEESAAERERRNMELVPQ